MAPKGPTNRLDCQRQLVYTIINKVVTLSLFAVCATTGKRKACADCSCGLAEELAGEVKQTPKSSCGSVSAFLASRLS